MAPFERPKRFEVFKAVVFDSELFVLVLSDDVPNALRRVVVACALGRREGTLEPGIPTRLEFPAAATGLPFDAVGSPASPITIPKNALVEKLGLISGSDRAAVDRAIRLTYGYEDWPL